MEPVRTIDGIAAPLPDRNIDTDQIIPASYLSTVTRTGLGAGLFHARRYDEHGNTKADFVLNKTPWNGASIIVAGDNFGCGSSREHAPWALKDFGIRCIIAPSFGDIFRNNCTKNGILTAAVETRLADHLMAVARNPSSCRFQVDLNNQTIRAKGKTYDFSVDEADKNWLLSGLDEISLSLRDSDRIDAYEQSWRAAAPWRFA